MNTRPYAAAFLRAVRLSWRDGSTVTADLFKSLIPIVVLVKLLSEAGVISYLALPLRPLMDWMGLPPELGLAWAAAILVNVYSGIIVFLGLLPSLPPLSVAQITTLALLFLIAHNLILETRLAGQCGISMRAQIVLRLIMAVAAGLIWYGLCRISGLFQETAVVLLESSPPLGWKAWAWNELLNLGKVYLIVCALMLLQRGMDYFRVSERTGRLLRPLLLLLGLSPQCAAIIIVGFSMGLIYGSGAIIKSARQGDLSPHDVFCSLSIMGVAHALIEDTLLMMVLGASMWGVLGLRLALAVALGVLLNALHVRRSRSGTGAAA